MKHLLTLADLTKEELYDLLDLADSLKKEVKKGVFTPYLRNKTLGMIFTKSSTRTRVSFETGMAQLGGTALYLNAMICSWDAESQSRIRHVCCPAIWMAL